MDYENEFWQLIEETWIEFSEFDIIRNHIIGGEASAVLLKNLNMALHEYILPSIKGKLASLSASYLISLDNVMERMLYDLDREDVHYFIEGSDDGFLYARGFIVGMGRLYYQKIKHNPFLANQDSFSWNLNMIESQEICFLFRNYFREKFGEDIPKTDISRESFSNKLGWPEE